MNKIREWVLNFLVKKYALGYLVKGYRAAEGWKTYLAMAACVIVFTANVFGYIPDGLADSLYSVIGTFGVTAFIEKLKRFQKTAESVATTIREEAKKP